MRTTIAPFDRIPVVALALASACFDEAPRVSPDTLISSGENMSAEDVASTSGSGSDAPSAAVGDDDASTTRDDVAQDDTAEGDDTIGTPAPMVIEDGLLLRYRLDDAPMAPQGGRIVSDSAPGGQPFQLEIVTPDQTPTAIDEGPSRLGVMWPSTDSQGTLRRSVADSKVAALDGASAFSIQVVAGIDEGHKFGSRFVHVGLGEETLGGHLDFVAIGTTVIELRIVSASPLARWTTPPLSPNRTVYTVSVDLLAEPVARLFINDVEIGAPTSADPLPTELSIDAADFLAVGNRSDGQRALDGRLFYVAVYDRALAVAEIQHNVAVLMQNDDSP